MTWTCRPFDASVVDSLARDLAVSPLIAQLLNQRGILGKAEAERFLHGTLHHLPDPFQLEEMDLAVGRLIQAIDRRESILFFGDYDVDGISGTAQLAAFWREIGAARAASFLLPHRQYDGYGLTAQTVTKIIEKKPSLTVTIDNGTNALEEIRALKQAGIDVIVIDHHETPKARPPVVALINPKRTGSRFPEKELASAGLVFLLLMALRKSLRDVGFSPLPNLKRYLEIATLGTIADVVPLVGTNRLIVKHGLEEMSRTSWPGLQALMAVGGVNTPVGAGAIGFRIAPRLNAAGRLDHPEVALQLLLARDLEEATPLAQRLDQLNRQRQQIEEKVLTEAIASVEFDQKDRKGLVVAGEGWHLGVVGIIASRLTELYRRPAVVLTLEGKQARGSARTIAGISIYETLSRVSDQMIRFGGHHAAAGLTIEARNLQNFAQKFDESVKAAPHVPITDLLFDAPLSLREVTPPLLEDLSLLSPHGAGNPEPVFTTERVQIENSRIVGKNHLKAVLSQEGARLEAIGFSLAPYIKEGAEGSHHRIAYSPQWNEWNGIRSVQIEIKNISPLVSIA